MSRKTQPMRLRRTAAVLLAVVLACPAAAGASERVLYEKTVALAVSSKAAAVLRSRGFTVKLTRTADRSVSLPARLALVQRVKPDLFVSVHMNAFRTTARRGATVVFQARNVKGQRAANRVLAALRDGAGLNPRGAHAIRGKRGGDFHYLLRRSPVTTLLVEAATMSNPVEAGLLADSAFRNRVALAIADGLTKSLPARGTLVLDPGHGGRDPGATGRPRSK